MKKVMKFYCVIWAILLALFNVISFVSVGWAETPKYTPSFWIGYIFITIAFIGQLICTYFALKDNDSKKTFYNISLISTSYTGLILSFIFGGLCMIISPLPYWVGIILCAIVLGLNAIAVVKASIAIDIVGEIDEKVKERTFFIKSLTVDAENLISRAKSEAVKAECKKVYEAIRYSDPMSNNALSEIEESIMLRFAEFSNSPATETAEELLALLAERNKKCKLLK